MAERINTTLTDAQSASWSPTDDFFLQVDSAKPVTVDVYVRMNAGLNWAPALTFRSDAMPLVRLAKAPFVYVGLRGNTAGNIVKIWDNA
jgi:hypothetical protein